MVSTAAFHARVRGSVPGLGGLKETKLFLPHPRVKVSIVGSLRDREVACSASDRQGSNFESCVWRTVSSQSSHHPQEVLLAQFSLYVHKGGLKPDSFHFIFVVPTYTHHPYSTQARCLPPYIGRYDKRTMITSLLHRSGYASSSPQDPHAQKTRVIDTMLLQCWGNVHDPDPTAKHNRINIVCYLRTVNTGQSNMAALTPV